MPRRPPPKLAGERAECAFAWQAMEHDLIVSRPYGDSAPYDFIVQSRRLHGAPLWRIQVKSSSALTKGQTYQISTQHSRGRYRLDELDFFAVLVTPVDAWYIVPIRAIFPRTAAGFYPHVPGSRSVYEKYRDAWDSLL